MLCRLIKQIYFNNIHVVLSMDEYKYSHILKQNILDIWNSTEKDIRYIEYNNIKSEVRVLNNKIIFVRATYINNNVSVLYISSDVKNNFFYLFKLDILELIQNIFNIKYCFEFLEDDKITLGINF